MSEKRIIEQNESKDQQNSLSNREIKDSTSSKLIDKRPEFVKQMKLQKLADSSSMVNKQAYFQRMADSGKVNKTGLPDQLKAGVETLSGHSMNDVKVHYNSDKPAQLNAHAFAQGTDIHLASGQEKHLPHEAWHVVQQKQGRVKPTTQLQGVLINDNGRLENEADSMGAKASQLTIQSKIKVQSMNYSIINNGSSAATSPKENHAIHPNKLNNPVQAVKFSRFLSGLYYNTDEAKLVAKEKEVTAFCGEMQQYAPRFPEINQLGQELATIKDITVGGDNYESVTNRLDVVKAKLNAISTKIALVGVHGGDQMMEAFGKNAADSITGRIIKIYLDTISVLPPVMKTNANEQAIKETIHPDAENNNIGYVNAYLGESDVLFAQKRHKEIISNLFALNNRVQKDWVDLQQKFGLIGGVKKITLSGSDLHKGGQQVVFIESEGGQKVVYKPRSTAPDAAILDSSTGVFAALNKKGAELSTMKFHDSKEHGSYVEFIEHQKLKTTAEIKEHYFKLGQLAIAAKLFGVNDLHYENIMAAAHGPIIIDGETSLLMNVMTARDFQSNELQKGIFEHVSEIDDKLSNNSFYTAQEKNTWEHLPEPKTGWDQYIGNIRKNDVSAGGLFEADLKRGIGSMLKIIKTNKKHIVNQTHNLVNNTNYVRVVPIATSKFKLAMNYYRDYKRVDNKEGMNGMVNNTEKQVSNSLRKKGYILQNSRSVKMLLKEDFDNGDIPILHYDGRNNKLTWNNRVIASRKDHGSSKVVINQNLKWILSQTVNDITSSLQG